MLDVAFTFKPMNELMLGGACVVLATVLVVQLLRSRGPAAAAIAALLHAVSGVAVCGLMLRELVFGAGEGFEAAALPAEFSAAASVLLAGVNLALGWTIVQARWGILASDTAALESGFRAACTLVLLNAPFIPVQASATGGIIAAAVACLGVAAAHLGGAAVRSAAAQRARSSSSLYA